MIQISGWISIHRKIQEHWLWDDKPFSKGQAWIDLLLMANHKENKFLLGNELVDVERGSFVTSELKLSKKWGWSRTKVRGFLSLLEEEQMIIRESDNKKTTLTIVNYSDYQISETAKEQQKNNGKTSEKHQKDINNNDNNENNDNKNIYSIFEHWNSMKIIQHRKLTDKMKRKIESTLKDYDVETLKEIISTYGEIVNNDKYWFTYKWSLEDFLQRGLKNFEDGDVARKNYLKEEKGNNQSAAKVAKKTRFHTQESRAENYTNDELEKIMASKRREAVERMRNKNEK